MRYGLIVENVDKRGEQNRSGKVSVHSALSVRAQPGCRDSRDYKGSDTKDGPGMNGPCIQGSGGPGRVPPLSLSLSLCRHFSNEPSPGRGKVDTCYPRLIPIHPTSLLERKSFLRGQADKSQGGTWSVGCASCGHP